jgi:hypothetical protein
MAAWAQMALLACCRLAPFRRSPSVHLPRTHCCRPCVQEALTGVVPSLNLPVVNELGSFAASVQSGAVRPGDARQVALDAPGNDSAVPPSSTLNASILPAQRLRRVEAAVAQSATPADVAAGADLIPALLFSLLGSSVIDAAGATLASAARSNISAVAVPTAPTVGQLFLGTRSELAARLDVARTRLDAIAQQLSAGPANSTASTNRSNLARAPASGESSGTINDAVDAIRNICAVYNAYMCASHLEHGLRLQVGIVFFLLPVYARKVQRLQLCKMGGVHVSGGRARVGARQPDAMQP